MKQQIGLALITILVLTVTLAFADENSAQIPDQSMIMIVRDTVSGRVFQYQKSDIEACRALHEAFTELNIPPSDARDDIVCDLMFIHQCRCEGYLACNWLIDHSGLCKDGRLDCNNTEPPECGCDTN